MKAKENALRIMRFNSPELVAGGCPTHYVAYRGCNHEGYSGGGHHLPVGSKWEDIWGTVWHLWQLGCDGGYFCSPDQGMPWPEEHIRSLYKAVGDFGRYPLQSRR